MLMRRIIVAIVSAYSALCISVVYAQHSTAMDIVDGKQAFQRYCANCHGPDGDLIATVDLGHGHFRQPYSDAELVNIITQGIDDTPMPATPGMSTAQAEQIVSYLRSLAITQNNLSSANDANGKRLYENDGNCANCHRINGQGSRLGPDLSEIGLVRTAVELEESLLFPRNEVQAQNRFYSVETKAGLQISGRLLNHDAFTVQLIDSNESLRSFNKQDLRTFGFSEASMPSLQGQFSSQQIQDIVSYLSSLRGLEAI